MPAAAVTTAPKPLTMCMTAKPAKEMMSICREAGTPILKSLAMISHSTVKSHSRTLKNGFFRLA